MALAFHTSISARTASVRLSQPRFQPRPAIRTSAPHKRAVETFASIEIAKGVEFDTIAREWRFKWSGDSDKASLI
ncbi:hypothetical protein CYMTET_14223, partial [Cymbomonas tetramitiformis]